MTGLFEKKLIFNRGFKENNVAVKKKWSFHYIPKTSDDAIGILCLNNHLEWLEKTNAQNRFSGLFWPSPNIDFIYFLTQFTECITLNIPLAGDFNQNILYKILPISITSRNCFRSIPVWSLQNKFTSFPKKWEGFGFSATFINICYLQTNFSSIQNSSVLIKTLMKIGV